MPLRTKLPLDEPMRIVEFPLGIQLVHIEFMFTPNYYEIAVLPSIRGILDSGLVLVKEGSETQASTFL